MIDNIVFKKVIYWMKWVNGGRRDENIWYFAGSVRMQCISRRSGSWKRDLIRDIKGFTMQFIGISNVCPQRNTCGCSISFFPERKNNRPGKTGKIYRKCLCSRTHFWERKLCCWKESVWIGFPKDAISWMRHRSIWETEMGHLAGRYWWNWTELFWKKIRLLPRGKYVEVYLKVTL